MTTITLDACTLDILPDESPDNPRHWDNLGTMACWHRRYALGDPHGYRDTRAFSAEVNPGNALILPLFLFDHGGLTLSTDAGRFRACDPAGWDWGQVGYVYAQKADVRREYHARRLTRQVVARALGVLVAEVATYNAFLHGDVFGYTLTDRASGEITDSCWGFFGDDPLTNGMADHLPPDVLAALQRTAA
jgi:hypothetical protein